MIFMTGEESSKSTESELMTHRKRIHYIKLSKYDNPKAILVSTLSSIIKDLQRIKLMLQQKHAGCKYC